MKAIVLSDSHGGVENIEKAVAKAGSFDTAIFLGDGVADFERAFRLRPEVSTYCVKGNCDYSSSLVEAATIPLGSHKVLITHGHRYGVRYDHIGVVSLARQNGCEAVLHGHTHIRFDRFFDGIRVFCPGSVSVPRDGLPKCFGIITEVDGRLEFEFSEL